MAEALWVQQSGIEYSAAEDRRAISALGGVGIVNGLSVTAGTGLQAEVSAGTAIVDDGDDGAYVAYTTSTTTLTLSPNATTSVYVKVNTTTAEVTVVSGTLPTDPYLTLGSVVTGASSVTSATNTAAASIPQGVVGKYLPLTGGTVSGAIQTTRVVVPGILGAGGVDTSLNAPAGVRLSGTSPTGKHHLSTTARTGAQYNIANAAYDQILWNIPTPGGSTNKTIYPRTPMVAGQEQAIYPGVSGFFLVTGYVVLSGSVTGFRRVRLAVCPVGSTTPSYAVYSSDVNPTTSGGVIVNFTSGIWMNTSQYLRIEGYQNSGGTILIDSGRLLVRLIQAD